MTAKDSNSMRTIRVEKVTLNIGTGKDQQLLEKAQRLMKNLTGIDSVKTITQKRIAAWGLRPGLPIGCKLTLRHEEAEKIIPRMLTAKDFMLTNENFDDNGNVSFGIKEYIDVKDAKYDPDIGALGLQCSVTLERPGFRIKKRKMLKKVIPMHHRIPREEAKKFMTDNYGVKFASKEEEE